MGHHGSSTFLLQLRIPDDGEMYSSERLQEQEGKKKKALGKDKQVHIYTSVPRNYKDEGI